MAEELKRSIESNQILRQRALQAIEKAKAEMKSIGERYDAQRARFEALVNGTAKMPCKE